MDEMSVPDAVHYGVTKSIVQDLHMWLEHNVDNRHVRVMLRDYLSQYLRWKNQSLTSKVKTDDQV